MNCIRTLWYFSLLTRYSGIGKSASRTLKNRNKGDSVTTFSTTLTSNRVDLHSVTTFSTKANEGPPWRILFMGTDDFSVKHLERLCSKYNTRTLISDLAVCTSPGSIVDRLARFENLTLYRWPLQVEDIINKYDIGIVVSFGHLIPKNIIDVMPLGVLNVHASLLPKWRGAAPIHYAIMCGDNETGVTVMKINPHRFDTGDILCQYKCKIGVNETTPELRNRLAEHGAELLMRCVRDLQKCLQNARPQKEEGVTYAHRVTSATAQIDWGIMTAHDIYNLHRAVGYLYPVHTRFQDIVVRFYVLNVVNKRSVIRDDHNYTYNFDYTRTIHEPKHTAELFMDSETEIPITTRPEIFTTTVRNRITTPGRIIYLKEEGRIYVACVRGRAINVKQLCVVGKKQCTPVDFYNGYLSKNPKRFWSFY